MADGNGADAGTGGTPQAPQINTLVQFMKDYSFENPNAPNSLQPQEGGPNISIQVNVNARQLTPTDFEVSLKLDGQAGDGPGTLFKFELEYGGVFRLQGIPEDQIHPVVMIECPRILFPFARHIVADGVRNGGFPPLYLDPIDFVGLYQQKAAEAQAQGSAPQSGMKLS